MLKKVIIASQNPVKIEAAKVGFGKMFPDQKFSFHGESVSSDISDQPMTDEETLTGANNRVKNVVQKIPDADYWVGIEGGLQRQEQGQMEVFAWIVIRSKNGKIGRSKTGTFFLPKRIVRLIEQEKELGEADDIVFRQTNSKQKSGAVGILTGDMITRSKYYSEAVILALIPFKNPDLY